MSGPYFAILEDDQRRIIAMREALASASVVIETVYFEIVSEMNEWIAANHEQVVLFSLDHDLGPTFERDGERIDPGDGRDLANFLADFPPLCPVIIHTTNRMGRASMQVTLEAAGRSCSIVSPINDVEWVAEDWLPLVCSLLDAEIRP